jgi:hypothetical protein
MAVSKKPADVLCWVGQNTHPPPDPAGEGKPCLLKKPQRGESFLFFNGLSVALQKFCYALVKEPIVMNFCG